MLIYEEGTRSCNREQRRDCGEERRSKEVGVMTTARVNDGRRGGATEAERRKRVKVNHQEE